MRRLRVEGIRDEFFHKEKAAEKSSMKGKA